jgi:hypothetical protein
MAAITITITIVPTVRKIKRAIFMPSKNSRQIGSDYRMLFEHTQRQYARACNRIIRQGQLQQDGEKNEPNGVR